MRPLALALLLAVPAATPAEEPSRTPLAPLRLPGEDAPPAQLLEWLDSEKPAVAAEACKHLSAPKHTAALREVLLDRARPARLRARTLAPLARNDDTTTATASLALRLFADAAEDPCVRRRAALFLNTVHAPGGTAEAIRRGIAESTPGIAALSYRLLGAMPPGDASLADVARAGLRDARREVFEICAAYLRRAKLDADTIRAEEARRFPRRGMPNPGRNAKAIFLDRELLAALRAPMGEWLDSPSATAQSLAINAAVAAGGTEWRALMEAPDRRQRELGRRAMWANRFGASDADLELVLRRTPADIGVLTRRAKLPGGPDAAARLVRMLRSPIARVRENARSILIEAGEPVRAELEKLATSKVVEFRMDASTILQQIAAPRVAPSLYQRPADREDLDMNAAQAPVANLLSDATEIVFATEGLEHLPDALAHPDPLVAAHAASALRRAGTAARPLLFRIADAAGKMPAQSGMFAVAAVREIGVAPDQMEELLDGLAAGRWDATTALALQHAAADCVQPAGWPSAIPALQAAAERGGSPEIAGFALRLLSFAARGNSDAERWIATRIPADLPEDPRGIAAWGVSGLGRDFAAAFAEATAAVQEPAARAARFDVLASLGERAEAAIPQLEAALADKALSAAAAGALLRIGPPGLAALRRHLATGMLPGDLSESLALAPAALGESMKAMLASPSHGERALAAAWFYNRTADAGGALAELWAVAMDEKAAGTLRADAFEAISHTGPAAAPLLGELEKALASPSPGVVAQAARILAHMGPAATAHIAALAAKGNDPNLPLEVRIACSDAAVKIGGEE